MPLAAASRIYSKLIRGRLWRLALAINAAAEKELVIRMERERADLSPARKLGRSNIARLESQVTSLLDGRLVWGCTLEGKGKVKRYDWSAWVCYFSLNEKQRLFLQSPPRDVTRTSLQSNWKNSRSRRGIRFPRAKGVELKY